MPPVRRPVLCTKELIAKVVDRVTSDGLHPNRAAVACGVSPRAHYTWMAKGTADVTEDNECTSVYADYMMQLGKAESELQAYWMNQLKIAPTNQWQRYGWLLERRFRDEYSMYIKPEKKETSPDSKTVVVVSELAQASI